MSKKKTNQDIIKSKIGVSYGGGIDYKPPDAGRYLCKNSDEDPDDEEHIIDESLLRELIFEIIRKCGDKWCLYTKSKDKKTGKRRRLGTHASREAAEKQERAIKSHGG